MTLNVKFPHTQCANCQGVAFLAMGVGMDKITEKNWREFWVRLHVLSAGQNMVEPSIIRAHAGMSMNVNKETWTQFKNKIVNNRRHDAEWALRKWDENNPETGPGGP